MKKRFGFALFAMMIFGKGFSQTGLYDPSVIQEIRIYFHEPDWNYILDSFKINDLGYLKADSVIINGTKINDAGIKYKGNSSYSSGQVKNPFTIKLDKFVSGQNYQGFSSLKLANCYDDPSMIREVLAYSILKNYMHCPRSNFAKIFVNDVLIGLYSNDEDITKNFVQTHFYSSTNPFFKASPVFATPAYKASLKYIDNNSASYADLYEKESSGSVGWTNFIALCDTITNSPSSIGSIMDIDRVLWMLAFDNVLVNLDSYLGVFSQNYFLYMDNSGKWNPIVWDLNMSFGGFNFAGSPNNGMGTLALSDMQTLSPLLHSTHSDWPLVTAIFQNEQYKRQYMAHYRTILNEMFASEYYKSLATTLRNTIESAVLEDNNKFFSDVQFQNGMTQNVTINGRTVPGLATLMDTRVAHLQTNTEFVKVPPNVSSISLSSYNPGVLDVVDITVNAGNSNFVQFSYRIDSTLKFTNQILYDDGLHNDGVAGDGIFGGTFTVTSNYTEYYFYAENGDAGIFFPARAEHEFYTLPGNPVELSINQYSQDNELLVFPNPTHKRLTVKTTHAALNEIRLIDVFGKEVLRQITQNNYTEIDLSFAPNGVYFLHTILDGNLKILKVMVQN